MNKALKIAASGVTGTSFMTLFSHILSGIADENFSEPEHLGTMLNRIVPATGKQFNQAAGWAAHYGVGLMFAAVYVEFWERNKIKPSFKNNLILGALSGLLAVEIWKLTFKMHPSPPWVNFTKYYTQLVGAHVVFAVFAGLTYRVLKTRNKQVPKELAEAMELPIAD